MKFFKRIKTRWMSLNPKRRKIILTAIFISVAILRAAKDGDRITHLLNSVSLSYEQFVRYIEFLKESDLIEECDFSYRTTSKGLKLIKEFDSSALIRSVLAG